MTSTKIKRYLISIFIITLLFSISSFALCDEITYVQEYKISINHSESHDVVFNFSNIDQLDNLSYIKSKDLYYKVNDQKIQNGDKITFNQNTLYPKYIKTFELVDKDYTVPWEMVDYKSLQNFDNYSEYLKSDFYYDYDSTSVQNISKKLGLSKDRPAIENISIISEFLINEMTYDMSHLGMTKASVVAQSMSGVCSDYTTLTVALLRNADIPARGVSGVRYDKDTPLNEISKNALHMWTEININGTWYILDTTLYVHGDYQPEVKELLDSIVVSSSYLPIGEITDSGSNKLSVNMFTQSQNPNLNILDNGFYIIEDKTQPSEANGNYGDERFDVNHWAYEKANYLDEKYDLSSDLNDFDLDRSITRLESANLIYKLTKALSDGEKTFPDVDSPVVSRLAYNGIINGYPNGEFRPNETITRESFFYLLGTIFTKYDYPILKDGREFVDVTESDWSKDKIHAVTRRLEITGYPDGTFKPKNNITVGEALFIISKAEQLKTVLNL